MQEQITILSITEDEFWEKYKPIKNHIDDNASWNGCMFETYGDEKEFCFELAQKENRVWTIIECDEIEADEGPEDDPDFDEDEEEYHPSIMYIISGFHLVNRIGFLVTEEPYTNDVEVKIED